MNFLTKLSAVLAAATLSTSNVLQSPPQDGSFELLILHNNDMHARFEQTSQLSGACTLADREAGKCYGGFPRVAHVVKEARKAAASGQGPPVLYLNAGDTYTGTAWFTIYKWKIAAEFVNALHPDAVSLGNHDFDNGVGGLMPFIQNLTCPVLAANLNLTKVPELATLPNLKNSTVIEINGNKIGIIGYLTPDTKYLAVENDVEYIDEIIAIKDEVAKLQSQGVNILIALGHSGYHVDMQIAKEVQGIDLVIGGHSHSLLWNGTNPDTEYSVGSYPTYITQDSGKLVPVVQAYAYTKYLGQLNVMFDSKGEIIELNGTPLLLDKTIPEDPEMLEIVEFYRIKDRNYSGEVVGKTSVKLDGVSCAFKECNLGNLVTDGMVYRYASEYEGEHWTDAPIAILQRGGIRSSIAHAEKSTQLTKGDIITVLPFGGNLVTITMNGSILMQMLEHSVSRYDLSLKEPKGEFLQYSGIKVVYDLSKPPGSRVVNATARCWACDIPEYFKIDDKQVYKILMPKFLASGGDGFRMLIGLPITVLPYNENASTVFYVRRHSPVYPEIEGRIILLTQSDKSFKSKSLKLLPPINLIMAVLFILLWN